MTRLLQALLSLVLLTLCSLTQAATPTVYYILNDALGTPRAVTNSSNQEVWRWEGESFGNTVPNSLGSGVTLNLRFPGQLSDSETGRNYNVMRDYDPVTGRYVQSDPIGLRGGLNTYTYVDGNPTNFIDPEGDVKRTPRFSCVNCGAPHGGLFGPYCPDCHAKSLDPNGGVAPLWKPPVLPIVPPGPSDDSCKGS